MVYLRILLLLFSYVCADKNTLFVSKIISGDTSSACISYSRGFNQIDSIMYDGRSRVNLWRRREFGSFNEVHNANKMIIHGIIRNVDSPEVAFDFGGRERVDVMRILSDTISCIAFCTRSRRISIRVLNENQIVADLPQMDCKLNDLCWGNDARMLISTDGSSMCRLWDIENLIELDSYEVGSSCSSIDFNRNGQIVATCEKGACIIDTRTGFGETRISKKRFLTSVKWSVSSRKILYATDNNQTMLMFDTRMLKRPALETKLDHSGLRLHSSPDGQFLFVNTPNKATLVNAYSLKTIQSLTFGSSFVSDTVQYVQSGGSTLCTAGNSSILAVPLDSKVYRIDFSPSMERGTRPLVHSILHGHASICKTTAFDTHHLNLYSGGTEILRWIPKKTEDIEEERGKEENCGDEEVWSDDE